MKHDGRIAAALNSWQLERFCSVFHVASGELEVVLSGWHKISIMSRDRVFLIPRAPQNARRLSRELSFYEWIDGRCPVPVPHLITRLRDRKISSCEIGVVSRLPGVPFAQRMLDVDAQQRARFLVRLAAVTAVWHHIAMDDLPAALSTRPPSTSSPLSTANWHRRVLIPGFTSYAVGFIYRFVRRLAAGKELPAMLANETATVALWTDACIELARLSPVLVHGDMHEHHVMVEPGSLSILGIVDWETVRAGNPVWDFNFGEWSTAICQWWSDLPDQRAGMWLRYLADRGLTVRHGEGLNLCFTLWDLLWMVHARRKTGNIVTGTDYPTAVEIHLQKLAGVTARL
jgi:hypothetical protein